MKSKSTWSRSVVLVGMLAVLPFAADADTSTDVESAIATTWRDHIEAAQRKDLAAVMKIYADNVIYIIPGAQEARGKTALEKIEAQSLASADLVEAVHTIDSLRVYGDLAYEIGTVVGPIREQGREPQTVTFHFMATWRHQKDGVWRIECMVGEPE